jgi:rhodanese-related sulfurtransferase
MAKQHSPRFLALASAAQNAVQRCSVQDVKQWMDSSDLPVLIDVREESEYAAGHLPNAIGLGRGILERDIETKVPEIGTKIVLYCGGGFRSALAAESLNKMGYTNVVSMDGGWTAWKNADLPTE